MTTQVETSQENKLLPSLEKRGIKLEDYRVIKEILYPNVQKDQTLLMALDYCKARKLDIMKRPIQIVPIWSSKEEKMIDTIWASIVEIRATATRTGEYAGQSEVEFGPTIKKKFAGKVKQKGGSFKDVEKEVTFPEWGKITVYRMVKGEPRAFTAKLYWLEAVRTLGYGCEVPNDMWSTRSFGQFEKCVEAAALRKAFPEEIGNDYIAEEAFSTESMTDVTPKSNEPKTPQQAFQALANKNWFKDAKNDFPEVEKTNEEIKEQFKTYEQLQDALCLCDSIQSLELFEEECAKDLTALKKTNAIDYTKFSAMLEAQRTELSTLNQ